MHINDNVGVKTQVRYEHTTLCYCQAYCIEQWIVSLLKNKLTNDASGWILRHNYFYFFFKGGRGVCKTI